ncbi:PLP-dependent aminotransferase family protein [Alteromonas sp. AMM-1]|uniref:aminotransferase-like domain-containing protein n=1 Tax=Alteromonas sp. AMM-1 TaxID=3394233 RepID=UPI0039A61CAE
MAKYEQLADKLASQIKQGIWQPGEKLPSLRKQSSLTGYSLMTVLHAYQLLESQGVLSAVQRSGYRVADSVEVASTTGVMQSAESVSVNDFVFDVLQASRDPHMFSLGFAYPDPALYPRHQLTKSLTAAAKQTTVTSALDNLPPGNRELRQLIAQRYAARGLHVSPDEIVITAGALEALSLSLQVVTKPGDWVLIESPAFYGAMQALERLGLRAVSVEVTPDKGINLAAVERALQNKPVRACWLMSNFQNPVGYSMTDYTRQALADLLAKYRVALIEDDVYAELYSSGQPLLPIKHFCKNGNSLLCSSFSKSLVAGFRIGWVAAGEHAKAIQKQQLMSTISTSVPIQMALVDYLETRNYEKHLHQLRSALRQRKKAMYEYLRGHWGSFAKVHHSSGGYFLWVEFSPQVDTLAIYHMALALHITLAPGRLFSLHGEYSHCLRINASFELTPARLQLLNRLTRKIIHYLEQI